MSRVGVAMRGRDAQHFYELTPAKLKHTVKVLHLDPARRITVDELRAHVGERVAGLPRLRRVPRRTRISHRWWQVLASVDVAGHVDVRSVGPGRPAREAAVAAELETPLELSRPPWWICLVDAPDGQAVVFTASHGLLDGFAASHLLAALFGPEFTPRPDDSVLLPHPVVDLAAVVGSVPSLLFRAVRAAARKNLSDEGRAAAKPFSGAAGAWNAWHPTGRRSYSEWTVGRAEFDRAARSRGATFTELAVAVAGGAMRLLHADDLPDRDMLAVVPAGTRRAGDADDDSNLITFLFVTMGLLVADPDERLRLVAASTRAAKARSQLGDPRLFADLWDLWPIVRRTHRLSQWVSRHTVGRPPASVVLSTVRGPQGPLVVAGSAVRSVVSGGVITDNMGLNITVWSAVGQVCFGVTGRPALVDVAAVADALSEAFEAFRTSSQDGSETGQAVRALGR